MKRIDVYSYGVVSSSTLYSLNYGFPQPQGYSEIKEVYSILGGEAANSSLVLSRLGVKVKLDGSWLSRNTDGKNVQGILRGNGVDVSRLKLVPRGVEEVVFSDRKTRTIFGTYGRMLSRRQWNKAKKEDVLRARVVNLDPFFNDDSFSVSKIAATRKIPVVTVDCKHDHPILKNTGVVIVAASFLQENYANEDKTTLLGKYTDASRALIIFTFGENGVVYGRQGGPVNHLKSHVIDTVDTVGGGDAFRAGIVFGLLKEWDDEKKIRFANALAAVTCTKYPGVVNSPGYREVQKFMKGHPMPPPVPHRALLSVK